jgi:non-ribosomal peptide synthetase component F
MTSRPPYQTFRGEIQPFAMTKALSDSIRDFSEAERVTRFAFVVAAFVASLQRYTAQQEIVLGTVAPVGRDRTELQHLLGYFLNPVALRIAVANDANFRTVLRHSSDVISDALSNAEVPFETVVEELNLDRDASRHPVFHVAVSMEPLMQSFDSWDLTPMDLQSGGARWDLYLVTDARPQGILGRVQYNPDLFDQQTITALVDDLCRVSEIVIRHPDLPLSSLLKDAVLSTSGSS